MPIVSDPLLLRQAFYSDGEWHQGGREVIEVTNPAGGTCAGKPCWKATGVKGYKYSDKALTPDGTLVEANRAPREAAGIQPDDVLGRKFWEARWWSVSPATQAERSCLHCPRACMR